MEISTERQNRDRGSTVDSKRKREILTDRERERDMGRDKKGEEETERKTGRKNRTTEIERGDEII